MEILLTNHLNRQIYLTIFSPVFTTDNVSEDAKFEQSCNQSNVSVMPVDVAYL